MIKILFNNNRSWYKQNTWVFNKKEADFTASFNNVYKN